MRSLQNGPGYTDGTVVSWHDTILRSRCNLRPHLLHIQFRESDYPGSSRFFTVTDKQWPLSSVEEEPPLKHTS